MKYFGYQHANGSLYLKRYLSKGGFDELKDSTFVETIFGPFNAPNKKKASIIFKAIVALRRRSEDHDKAEARP